MFTGLLFLGAALGLVAVGVWKVQRIEQQRTEAIRAAATRLGWGFQPEVPYDAIPRLDRFELFDRGRNRTLRNLLTSPAGDPRAVVFDYTFVTGGGKSQQTHRQTVFYATSHQLELPAFSLRPENFLHRIGEIVGFQDIDLEAHPEFSRLFLLRGADEAAIRSALGDRVVAFLERRPGVCAAGLGAELLYWRPGRRVDAAELETLIRDGFELAAHFRDLPAEA